MRRVRWLPEVFAARGREPLPPGHRRRPRPTLLLLGLGVFVSLTAGLGLCAVGYGALALRLAVHGPRDDLAGVAATAVGCGVVAALAPRGRTWLVRRWMAQEQDRAARDGGGPPPSF